MRERVTAAVFCASLILSSFSAHAGHRHYGHYHHGHDYDYLYPHGAFVGGLVVGSYLTQPRYPTYPPPVYYGRAFNYQYVYPSPLYVASPAVVYTQPRAYYVRPSVTYVERVIPAPPRPTVQATCLSVREYQTEIVIGGKAVEAYGFACLKPDDSWERGAPQPVP